MNEVLERLRQESKYCMERADKMTAAEREQAYLKVYESYELAVRQNKCIEDEIASLYGQKEAEAILDEVLEAVGHIMEKQGNEEVVLP